MPEVGEIVELDNGMIGRVVEVMPDAVRVELLNADETPTGETIDIPVTPTEDEPAEVEAPEGDSAEAPEPDEMAEDMPEEEQAAADEAQTVEPGALRAAPAAAYHGLRFQPARPARRPRCERSGSGVRRS